MSDHAPAPEKTGILAGLRGLDRDTKAFIGVGTVIVGAFVAGRGCHVVSASELSEVVKTQRAVDAKQDQDLELLFQTQVRLTTSADFLKEQVQEVRKDLRAMDAGRPLPPLASPTAHPTPAVP